MLRSACELRRVALLLAALVALATSCDDASEDGNDTTGDTSDTEEDAIVVDCSLPAGPLLAAPLLLDFGTVQVGNSEIRTLNVRNDGDNAACFDLDPVTVPDGAPITASSLRLGGETAPYLLPGQTGTFELTFAPTEAATGEGELSVQGTNTAPVSITVRWGASGSAVECAQHAVITSEEDLEAIAGCNTLGALTIENSTLTDLSPLAALNTVDGDLIVRGNSELTSLHGLEGLTTVGRDLVITGNDSLTSVDALDALETLGRDLELSAAQLSSEMSFSALRRVNGNLRVAGFQVLDDLAAFDELASIGGSLVIEQNSALASISGMARLVLVEGDLTLRQMPCLQEIVADDFVSRIALVQGTVSIDVETGICN